MNLEVLFICYSEHELSFERRCDEFVLEHLMGDLEGMQGGDTVVGMCCMRGESIFNEKQLVQCL